MATFQCHFEGFLLCARGSDKVRSRAVSKVSEGSNDALVLCFSDIGSAFLFFFFHFKRKARAIRGGGGTAVLRAMFLKYGFYVGWLTDFDAVGGAIDLPTKYVLHRSKVFECVFLTYYGLGTLHDGVVVRYD